MIKQITFKARWNLNIQNNLGLYMLKKNYKLGN